MMGLDSIILPEAIWIAERRVPASLGLSTDGPVSLLDPCLADHHSAHATRLILSNPIMFP